MSTLKKVAERARVSFSTVSRAINHPDKVKPATLLRVERAIADLDYRPHRAARRLRGVSKHASIFGLIIPDIQNAFYSQIVRGAEEVAYSQGYAVIICNSDESAEREHFYLDVLRQEAAAGVLLPPLADGEGDVLSTPDTLPFPVICFDRRPSSDAFDAVLVDNEGGAYAATQRLATLGHRRIGAVLARPTLSTSTERLAGYHRALADSGLDADDALLRMGAPRREDGQALTAELLALPQPPTALFVGNNVMTMGALEAIRASGRIIPDDLALIAFDDPPWAALVTPPLTTVRQPAYLMGQRAAEMLLRRIATPDLPAETVTLPATLVIRASCGTPVSALAL